MNPKDEARRSERNHEVSNARNADATQRLTEIHRGLTALHEPGSIFEVRAIGIRDRGRPHTAAGYFDDCDTAAQIISQFDADRRPEGIYLTLNEVQPPLLARSPNRITNYLETTTSDSDIAKRRWLLLDFDPKRPRGISSTKEELSAAKELAKACRDWLCGPMNWPEPVEALSGNGWHLLFRIDLPNDDEARQLVADVLLALNARFSTDFVIVDTTVHNAGRITKCYGTTARKGANTPDRPHRQSKIVQIPHQIGIVPLEALHFIAAMAPKEDVLAASRKNRSRAGTFNHRLDVARWLADYDVQFEVKSSPTSDGRTVYRLAECPFYPGHGTRGEVAVMQGPNGRLSAKCMHDSCARRGWQDFKEAIGKPDPLHYEPPLMSPFQAGDGDTTPKKPGNNGVVSPSPVLPPWKPFPVDCLPQPLGRFVDEAARSVGCDPSFVACPLLAAVASAIGNTRRIRLKRDWHEPAVIWIVVIGDSGSLKSPAHDLVLKFVRRLQDELFRNYFDELTSYEGAMVIYEKDLAEWKKCKQPERQPPEKSEPPICERLLCSDTTVESIALLLQHAPRGLLLARDELAGWLNSFNQYKGCRGHDVAHWLEMHRAGYLLVDRKTGPVKSIHVPRAAVSITGGIQPGILKRCLGREHFEDGLAPRLLLAKPPGKRKRWTEDEISPTTEAELAAVFERLYSLKLHLDDEGNLSPIDLPLTSTGKRAWIQFYNEHAAEQADLSGDLAAAWSKLEGYAARLALVVHLVRWGAKDPTLSSQDAVDEKSVKYGVTLARWFGYEDQRIYSMLDESEETREQRELIELVQRRGGRITARELMRSSRKYRASSEGATETLNTLVKEGHGRWLHEGQGGKGGRPAHVFELDDAVTVTEPQDSPENNEVVSPRPSGLAENGKGSNESEEYEWMG